MSLIADAFSRVLGRPERSTPSGLQFSGASDQEFWHDLESRIGAGCFLDGFVYLFGEELRELEPCLEEWSFLFEHDVQRQVIGKNAYGALLVIEDADAKGLVAPVGMIDPWRVQYWQDPNVAFLNLLGAWLPEGRVGDFLERSIYEGWRQVTGEDLELLNILAMKVPFQIGGELVAQNFQLENIHDYYRSTGAIYRKALSRE